MNESALAQPVRSVFDTDTVDEMDDALALAMIHALESRGAAELLAVTITKGNRWAAPYVDLANTYYGRPDIPIGTVRDGKTPTSPSPGRARSRCSATAACVSYLPLPAVTDIWSWRTAGASGFEKHLSTWPANHPRYDD